MGADLAALMRAAAADAEPSQAAMFPAGDDLPPLWSGVPVRVAAPVAPPVVSGAGRGSR